MNPSTLNSLKPTANQAVQYDILIFKTNIHLKQDVKAIEPVLKNDTRIAQWNIDRDDIDNVLRIESSNLSSSEIISRLAQAGYYCEELPD